MGSENDTSAAAAPEAARPAAASGAREEAAAPTTEESLEHLTYEGTRVPAYLVLVWLVFFVWGVIYLLTFVPASVREWFLGK